LASELLFDLSKIDLNQVAMVGPQVDRYLPQTGPMRMLDQVVWLDLPAMEGVGLKRVRDDEFWVPHHIPGRPLLPGVLMIEAAAQLCSLVQTIGANVQGFLGFTRCDETVFRGQVVPGDSLYILAKQVERNRRRFVSRAQGVVNGKLVFETLITGMTF
jgi:3-hydroxyacyl-[acyl-carrier-protein] dehydratase